MVSGNTNKNNQKGDKFKVGKTFTGEKTVNNTRTGARQQWTDPEGNQRQTGDSRTAKAVRDALNEFNADE